MDVRIRNWLADDEAMASFVQKQGGVSFLSRSGSDGQVMLALAPGRLHIRVDQEASCTLLLDLCRQAVECGILKARVDTLFDLSGFIGSIDWDAIAQMGKLQPWWQSGQNKFAYLFHDEKNGLLIKVLGVMFPGVEHRVFATKAGARDWLGW